MVIETLLRNQLTREQIYAVEGLGIESHLLVAGQAGSGKTQVLLYRTNFLRDLLKADSSQYQIFVYTNTVKNYIKSQLKLLDIPEDNISTFESWYINLYRNNISRKVPKSGNKYDYSKMKNQLIDKIKKGQISVPMYKFIMIDEGQDLDDLSYKLAKLVTGHITVCFDPTQRIFENGCNEKDIVNILEIKGRNITILNNFRCSPNIADVAKALIDDPIERKIFIEKVQITKSYETPLLYKASNFDEEKKYLFKMITNRLEQNDSIGVIFPTARQAHGIASDAHNFGLEVENPDQIDFTTNKPKFTTYFSAKGLSFDSVMMPRLTKRAFSWLNKDMDKNLIFVGVTRARKWVYLSTLEDNENYVLNTIRPHLSVKSTSMDYANETLINQDTIKINHDTSVLSYGDLLD